MTEFEVKEEKKTPLFAQMLRSKEPTRRHHSEP
jgi:hypothetical protein